MLKSESNFDAHLSDPAMDEYGIARWTPRVLRHDGKPTPEIPKPPFTPAQSIPAMSRYLCAIAPRLKPGRDGDGQVLVAAAYRTSYRKVNEAGGVPRSTARTPTASPTTSRSTPFLETER